MGLFPLNSIIQPYKWGSRSWIPDCLGLEPSGRPQAELWMGAHSLAPSPLVDEQRGAKNLKTLIQGDPKNLLGSASKFGGLPFLFKLLAAQEPLSLQAHPSARQAQVGFAKEQAEGISQTAGYRNYKDCRHKPEMILALTPFHALSGFRQPDESVKLLSEFFFASSNTPSHSALLLAFATNPTEAGLEAYFRGLFDLEPVELNVLTQEVVRRSQLEERSPFGEVLKWWGRLASKYPGDPGVLGALLLNHIELSPGEAIYLPAGNLHAYLSGLALEVMASSDNVLRGGLTSKHVDVDELCRILRFEPFNPPIIFGEVRQFGAVLERRYCTDAEEFELGILEFGQLNPEGDSFGYSVDGPEIWLGLEGEVCLEQGRSQFKLSKGSQIFISPGDALQAFGTGRVARASLPR